MSYAEIDLFLAVDAEAVGVKILNGIENLIHSLSKKPESLINTLFQYFQKANKKWSINFKGIKLELQPESKNDVIDNILYGFKALEYLLNKKNKKVIVFLMNFRKSTN